MGVHFRRSAKRYRRRTDEYLVLCSDMPATASAIAEFGRSKIASTLSFSYQRRAMPTPTSGLFW